METEGATAAYNGEGHSEFLYLHLLQERASVTKNMLNCVFPNGSGLGLVMVEVWLVF